MKILENDKLLLKAFLKTDFPKGISFLDESLIIEANTKGKFSLLIEELFKNKEIVLYGEDRVYITKNTMDSLKKIINRLPDNENTLGLIYYNYLVLVEMVLNKYVVNTIGNDFVETVTNAPTLISDLAITPVFVGTEIIKTDADSIGFKLYNNDASKGILALNKEAKYLMVYFMLEECNVSLHGIQTIESLECFKTSDDKIVLMINKMLKLTCKKITYLRNELFS